MFGSQRPLNRKDIDCRYSRLYTRMSKSYFDSHAHSYQKDPGFYLPLINHIDKVKSGERIKILDIGCGDGSFIQAMNIAGVKTDSIGIDFSLGMVSIARKNLSNNQKVELFLADGFKLPLTPETKFDLIHVASVLHHLIGSTKGESMRLVNTMLNLLINRLSENGILVVEEVYYVSYMIPHITSSIVFYGLKLLNFLHLDLSRIMNELQPGLEVNFLSEQEMEKFLGAYSGTVHRIRKYPQDISKLPKLYRFFLRIFLLKESGYISIIHRKDTSMSLAL